MSNIVPLKRTYRCQMRDGSKFVILHATSPQAASDRYLEEYHDREPDLIDDITPGFPEKRVRER